MERAAGSRDMVEMEGNESYPSRDETPVSSRLDELSGVGHACAWQASSSAPADTPLHAKRSFARQRVTKQEFRHEERHFQRADEPYGFAASTFGGATELTFSLIVSILSEI